MAKRQKTEMTDEQVDHWYVTMIRAARAATYRASAIVRVLAGDGNDDDMRIAEQARKETDASLKRGH